jgi:hypothetical protein
MLTAAARSGVMPAQREEPMDRYRIVALTLMAGLACLVLRADQATAAGKVASAEKAASLTDVSAQRRRVRRSPLRIEVYPRGIPLIGPPGQGFDIYPRPYPFDWPGPNTHRECIGWLAPEARLTGTVIVPHRRCWWVSG